MPLSTNPTFKSEKLKKQASELTRSSTDTHTKRLYWQWDPTKILKITFARCNTQRSSLNRRPLPMSCQVRLQTFTQSRSGDSMTWRRWLTMWRSCSRIDQRESFSRLRKPQAWNIQPTTLKVFHMRLRTRCIVLYWLRAGSPYVMWNFSSWEEVLL